MALVSAGSLRQDGGSRMVQLRSCLLGLAAAAALPILLGAASAHAQPAPVRVRVTLQPDCYRSSLSAACDARKTGMRLDLGPQIAVWIEGADGRFVDTVLVTNLTARLGIGNRPGHYLLPSSPKFPYGRRLMSLPVWAQRRGKLYDSVVMQDGTDKEYWLGFHESVSSPDPYFCRPMTFQEIDVDAVSCPTARFNSAKGRFFDPALDLAPQHLENGQPKGYVPPARTYYPPRNDLTTFTDLDCDGRRPCTITARSYAGINDLDGVAAATPPYGRPFSEAWRVPDAIPDGDYAVLVEVNKEFDENGSHRHPAIADPMLREWGLTNNFGQPSVVFRVPFRLDRRNPTQAATSRIAGYGDWDGRTGTLHPPDQTISETPGSGTGRLLVIAQPSLAGGAPVMGRVHVTTEAVTAGPPVDAAPPPASGDVDAGSAPPRDGASGPRDAAGPGACLALGVAMPLEVASSRVMSEGAEIELVEPARELWEKTEHYEVRVWYGSEHSAAAFEEGLPLPRVQPVQPGNRITVALSDLKSESRYTVGVRPRGACADPPIAFTTFTTVIREFAQLSGCFIATAAYGGPLAPRLSGLRRARDGLRDHSALGAAAADAYARASPPMAEVLRASEAARAVVRTLLSPVADLLERARSLP
jgi:hypothetical protein